MVGSGVVNGVVNGGEWYCEWWVIVVCIMHNCGVNGGVNFDEC